MKKTTIKILFVALIFGTFSVISTSCSKSGKDDNKSTSDKKNIHKGNKGSKEDLKDIDISNYIEGNAIGTEETANLTEDSSKLSTLAGKQMGYYKVKELEQVRERNNIDIDLDQYLSGIGEAMGKKHSIAYVSGLSLGSELVSQVTYFVDSGVPLNQKVIIEKIKANIDPKTKDLAKLQYESGQELGKLLTKIYESHFKSTPAQIDSVQTLFGQTAGAYISSLVADNEKQNKTPYNLDAFLKGMEKLFAKKYSNDYINGIVSGARVAQEIYAFEKANEVGMIREQVFKEMSRIIKADYFDEDDLKDVNVELQTLLEKIEKEHNEKEEARLSETPEAIQNTKTGEAFINKLKKENTKAKTSESGLTYIIENPGKGERIKDSDMASVRYRGTHLDGKEFDSNDSITFSPMGVVPGFAEGLKMLGKGGKAKLYIPGKLGYGAKGVPQGGIGPNEMLVFDIEILDIIRH